MTTNNGLVGVVKAPENECVTVDQLKELFPEKKNVITQEHADFLNAVQNDGDMEMFKSELVTYKAVMNDNSLSMKQYMQAVKFVAYLPVCGYDYTQAYCQARAMDKFVIERREAVSGSKEHRELTNQASRFANLPYVKQLMLQAAMPTRLWYKQEQMRAMDVLVEAMTVAPQWRDRIAAAKEVLTATKDPENDKSMELKIGMTDDAKAVQQNLADQIAHMAEIQMQAFKSGKKLDDIQKVGINIIDAKPAE